MDEQTRKQIVDFVQAKPRSIQEIAHLIGKHWRTADRYVQQIQEESGAIATRTFREGTRGALKVVYYVSLANVAGGVAQERLLSEILAGREKADFSPFDIYQYIPSGHRSVLMEHGSAEQVSEAQDLVGLLRGAQHRVLLFSGNLSWLQLHQGKIAIADIFEELARRGVAIRIVCRVDVSSQRNLEVVRGINNRLGRDAIEVRHAHQPLRCTIVDGKLARLKETKDAGDYKPGELDGDLAIYYTIEDETWIEWLEKVFWKIYSMAIPLRQRLEALETLNAIGRARRSPRSVPRSR